MLVRDEGETMDGAEACRYRREACGGREPLLVGFVGLPSAIPISVKRPSLRESGVGILAVGIEAFRGDDRGLLSGVGNCPRANVYGLNPAPGPALELTKESSLEILLSYLKLLLIELLELGPLDELGRTDMLTPGVGVTSREKQYEFALANTSG